MLYGEKPIEASGRRTERGGYDINYSSILSRLIFEAGRWCRRFASDLFIDWYIIQKKLDDGSLKTGTYLFGFREDGVDGTSFIEARYENESLYGRAYLTYRALWRMDVEVNDDEVKFTLYECSR